jgi:hypothetical protein
MLNKAMLSSILISGLWAALAFAPPLRSAAPDGSPRKSAADEPGANTAQTQVPAGTVVVAELSKSLDAKKVKVGTAVEARTTMDLLAHGQIVVPRNTKIIGHVTQVQPRTKGATNSMVAIAFDRMSMKDGRELPIQAVIQAVGPPLQQAMLPAEGPPAGAGGGLPSNSPMGRGNEGVGMPGGAGRYPTAGSPSEDTSERGSSAPALGPNSHGVVGMRQLKLDVPEKGPSVVSSDSENVHLSGGTQLVLKVQ